METSVNQKLLPDIWRKNLNEQPQALPPPPMSGWCPTQLLWELEDQAGVIARDDESEAPQPPADLARPPRGRC